MSSLASTPVAVSNPWYVSTAAVFALVGGLLARRLSADSTLLVIPQRMGWGTVVGRRHDGVEDLPGGWG